ncbi:MAG: hypothetical protein J0M15_07120 [Deltaproteobacteria bacterium]|nr:hypothetical protein [Deltaproteobacteria bacterium]
MKKIKILVSLFCSLIFITTNMAHAFSPPSVSRFSSEAIKDFENRYHEMKSQGGNLMDQNGNEISFDNLIRGLSGTVTYFPESTSPWARSGITFQFSSVTNGKQILVKALQNGIVFSRRVLRFEGKPEEVKLTILQTLNSLEQEALQKTEQQVKNGHKAERSPAALVGNFQTIVVLIVAALAVYVCATGGSCGMVAVFIGAFAIAYLTQPSSRASY